MKTVPYRIGSYALTPLIFLKWPRDSGLYPTTDSEHKNAHSVLDYAEKITGIYIHMVDIKLYMCGFSYINYTSIKLVRTIHPLLALVFTFVMTSRACSCSLPLSI